MCKEFIPISEPPSPQLPSNVRPEMLNWVEIRGLTRPNQNRNSIVCKPASSQSSTAKLYCWDDVPLVVPRLGGTADESTHCGIVEMERRLVAEEHGRPLLGAAVCRLVCGQTIEHCSIVVDPSLC
uniref:Uncharacterized protein n=1 Tax=Globodera pallida TaxID=36090 RepID=A0A183C2M4_GLOPA